MLQDGMAKAAAFLETRRYVGYVGATTEFSRWEGLTFDSKRNKLYGALTDVTAGAAGLSMAGSVAH